MTFKVFRITDADNKNVTDLERISNEFETDLDIKDMQITTSPILIGDNILLIIQYGPKSKKEITESL